MLQNRDNLRESPLNRSKSPPKDSRNSNRKPLNIPSIFSNESESLDTRTASTRVFSRGLKTPNHKSIGLKKGLKTRREKSKPKTLMINENSTDEYNLPSIVIKPNTSRKHTPRTEAQD